MMVAQTTSFPALVWFLLMHLHIAYALYISLRKHADFRLYGKAPR